MSRGFNTGPGLHGNQCANATTPPRQTAVSRCMVLALGALGASLCLAQPALRDEPQPIPRTEALRIEVLEGTFRSVVERGNIALAYREDAVPFSYILPGRARPVGYSIDICLDIVQALSARLGMALTVRWVPVTAESRFQVIEQGLADLECGSTSSTPERLQSVAFSPPIFITGARVLVPRARIVRSPRDLQGLRAGTVEGSTVSAMFQGLATGADQISFPDYRQAFDALQAGKLDALVADDVLLHGLIDKEGVRAKYRIAGPWLTHEVYGIVYHRGDPQMAAFITDTLNHLAAQRDLSNYYSRWFLKRLPGGERLGLPMSPALQSVFQLMAREAEPGF